MAKSFAHHVGARVVEMRADGIQVHDWVEVLGMLQLAKARIQHWILTGSPETPEDMDHLCLPALLDTAAIAQLAAEDLKAMRKEEPHEAS